jgi:maltose alpha-D-glucosyltransferase/alpha-amylase
VRPPAWLADAVLYQVYPQSFSDSNGDGIGDLPGLTARIDHLAWLGVNVVWLNPCFSSPFGDAGYDVSDYLSIAPRYGTNEDLEELVEAARSRGIRVLLDLVAGHTSDRHPWFTASADDPRDHRYIWSETLLNDHYLPSPGARAGYYLPNFYPFQPALNYGYARPSPGEPHRQAVDADGPRANRVALREVMAHWLDVGVSGFRVDMAFSLVKDDPGRRETARLWSEMREWLDAAYPEAALIAEWGEPAVSVPAGFHADFFLHFTSRALPSLWDNGAGTFNERLSGRCYFDSEGGGSPGEFLDEWRAAREALGPAGWVILPTSNHDFSRLACGPRTRDQLGPAFCFLLTWPTVPAIYQGDEIGMRYVPGLPDKEGSRVGPRNNRSGSRTPMQWDDRANAGFSTASSDRLYLPVDPDLDRPTVAAQLADRSSLLWLVRRLIAQRRATPALGSDGSVDVLHAGYPFVYVRGNTHLVVVNPRREPASASAPGWAGARAVEVSGVDLSEAGASAAGFSFGIFER